MPARTFQHAGEQRHKAEPDLLACRHSVISRKRVLAQGVDERHRRAVVEQELRDLLARGNVEEVGDRLCTLRNTPLFLTFTKFTELSPTRGSHVHKHLQTRGLLDEASGATL